MNGAPTRIGKLLQENTESLHGSILKQVRSTAPWFSSIRVVGPGGAPEGVHGHAFHGIVVSGRLCTHDCNSAKTIEMQISQMFYDFAKGVAATWGTALKEARETHGLMADDTQDIQFIFVPDEPVGSSDFIGKMEWVNEINNDPESEYYNPDGLIGFYRCTFKGTFYPAT